TCSVFFLIDPSTTEIYTLSLHDALPIWLRVAPAHGVDEARLWHLHDRQSPFAAERSLRADRRAVHRDGSDRRDDEPDVFREPREEGVHGAADTELCRRSDAAAGTKSGVNAYRFAHAEGLGHRRFLND